MSGTKISAAADVGALLTTDMLPIARAGSTTAYKCTIAELTSYATGTTGVASWNGRGGAVSMTLADVTGVGGAANASPNLTGIPTAPTATAGTSTTQLATTQFVAAAVSAGTAGVSSFNTRTGAVTLSAADVTGAGGAPLASPALTGTPTSPTAASGTNTTQIASTAFVAAAIAAAVPGDIGRNKLHNSMFNVQQRGAGSWTAANAYTADRWVLRLSGDTVSVSLAAQSDAGRSQIGDEASRYALLAGVTGNALAGSYSTISQCIEGVQRLSGKTIIVSFYAYSATAGLKLGVNALQNFGSGGSPSGSVWALATGGAATIGSPWARYSTTIALPSTSGKTLGTNGDDHTELWLWFSSGATNNALAGNIGVQTGNFNLWGIQLEIAAPGQTTPSPLEKPDPRYDRSNCERFYQGGSVDSVAGYNGTGAAMSIYACAQLPTTMRATPAITPTYNYAANVGSGSASATPGAVTFTASVPANGAYIFAGTFTASADL